MHHSTAVWAFSLFQGLWSKARTNEEGSVSGTNPNPLKTAALYHHSLSKTSLSPDTHSSEVRTPALDHMIVKSLSFILRNVELVPQSLDQLPKRLTLDLHLDFTLLQLKLKTENPVKDQLEVVKGQLHPLY